MLQFSYIVGRPRWALCRATPTHTRTAMATPAHDTRTNDDAATGDGEPAVLVTADSEREPEAKCTCRDCVRSGSRTPSRHLCDPGASMPQ